MAPSIVSFAEFLRSEKPQFKTLHNATVVTINGNPIITRTSQFTEAQIAIDGKRYLLCLPLNGVIDTDIERTANALERLCAAVLTEYRLLKGEITLPDSTGREVAYDVILHALPEGDSLDKAISFVATARLRSAFELLKRELTEIGFLHRNLKPSNIIYGTDGRLYPIRYHYAQLGASAEDISKELHSIEEMLAAAPEIAEIGEDTTPDEYENRLPYDEVFPMQDMMRRIRSGELYGYLDGNDNLLIEPQFTYAENFFENRAVVQTREGKMGVINHDCQWIVEPIYDMLGFEDGIFNARIGYDWIKIDYMGKIIK